MERYSVDIPLVSAAKGGAACGSDLILLKMLS
jgi:hypothetical protein